MSLCKTIILPVILISPLAAGIVFIITVVAILSDTSLYCGRGSFEYRIAITSEIVRDFPLIGACRELKFHSSSGDVGRPANGILYLTDASTDTVIRLTDEYLKKRGYVFREQSGPYMRDLGDWSLIRKYRHTDESDRDFELDLTGPGKNNQIKVRSTEYNF